MAMIRTQVYLPEELHRDLKLLANTEGVNFSGLIREGAGEVIKKRRKVGKAKKWGQNFIGAGIKGGPRDVASKIDYYLYGEGNPKWAKR